MTHEKGQRAVMLERTSSGWYLVLGTPAKMYSQRSSSTEPTSRVITSSRGLQVRRHVTT
jgi:hypothetical protein